MSFESYPLRVGEVPLLMVSEGPPVSAAQRGTVLLFHGLGASKDTNRLELDRFASEGFLAIGVDAVGHGERFAGSLDQRFPHPGPERDAGMVELVAATVRELPALVRHLRYGGLVCDGRLGLFGISMGGYIAYGAAPQQIASAIVAVIASPDWPAEAPEHPMRHVDHFAPCALLSQIALRDELVPPEGARRLHAELAGRYGADGDRLALVEYPESPHFMREEDWHQVMQRSVDWFKRFLVAP